MNIGQSSARLLPAFGTVPLEETTAEVIQAWRLSLGGLANRSENKLLIVLHGIFRRAQTVYGVTANPLALRWRDVDFAGSTVRVRTSYAGGELTTPESGKVRAVPLAPDAAATVAQLGRRADWIADDDLVFAGCRSPPVDLFVLAQAWHGLVARVVLTEHGRSAGLHVRPAPPRAGSDCSSLRCSPLP